MNKSPYLGIVDYFLGATGKIKTRHLLRVAVCLGNLRGLDSGFRFGSVAVRYRLRCWLSNGECGSVRIQVMLPLNPNLPELKHVLIFEVMHFVSNVMRNHALQFAGETLKHTHLATGKERRLLKVKDVARDRLKVLVDAGESLISFQFAFQMVSSQVASNTGDLVRGALLLQQRRVSLPSVQHFRIQRKRVPEVSARTLCADRGVFVQEPVYVQSRLP